VHVVPHWIDIDYWTVRVPPAPELSERDVFVLNHMGQARNAVGLREIADALVRRCGEGAPRLLVASSEAPHEALRDAHLGVVQFLGYVEDPRPYYRAKVALVPSFEVTGTKTTILQAWAAGCPVVTTTRAAASVGATSGAEVLAGSDPNEVAAMLVRVLRDDDLANDLVENGRKRLTQAYGSAAARDALDEVLAATVRRSRRHR
jgi:glycosyltransferase involved in cell wall biosynthesis